MNPQVLVVGSPMLDVIAQGAGHFPRRGRTEPIDGVLFGLGGCALNTALVTARLGVPTAMAGLLGDDLPGRMVLDLLAAEPLGISRIGTVEGDRTTVCLVFVAPGGDRQFLIATAAGEKITADHVGDLAGFRVVHVGAALQLHGLDVGELFRRAKAAGALTTLDVENGPALDQPDRLRAWFPFVDWFMPSEEEAMRATGCASAEAAAAELRSLGAGGVIVKLGSRGCLVESPSGRAIVAAPQVTIADTTGAGDCFVAGFIAGLVWGFDVASAARLACGCGACAVTALGATAAIRSLEDVVAVVSEDLRARLREKVRIDAQGT